MRKLLLSNSGRILGLCTSLSGVQGWGITMAMVFGLMMVEGYSQHAVAKVESNELKLNTLYLPGGYTEISYERILGNKSAVGISAGLMIGSAGPNYATDILTFNKALFPYYRYYFGKRRATGLFMEANTIVFSENSILYERKKTGWGLGLAVGVKFLLKTNWYVDFFAGGGSVVNSRNPNSDFLNFPDMYPRLGLSIGKRF